MCLIYSILWDEKLRILKYMQKLQQYWVAGLQTIFIFFLYLIILDYEPYSYYAKFGS